MKTRRLGANGPVVSALDVTLTAGDLARIKEVTPKGAASGERYPGAFMRMVDR